MLINDPPPKQSNKSLTGMHHSLILLRNFEESFKIGISETDLEIRIKSTLTNKIDYYLRNRNDQSNPKNFKYLIQSKSKILTFSLNT